MRGAHPLSHINEKTQFPTECFLLAYSRPLCRGGVCLLMGVNRTCPRPGPRAANDPKQTYRRAIKSSDANIRPALKKIAGSTAWKNASTFTAPNSSPRDRGIMSRRLMAPRRPFYQPRRMADWKSLHPTSPCTAQPIRYSCANAQCEPYGLRCLQKSAGWPLASFYVVNAGPPLMRVKAIMGCCIPDAVRLLASCLSAASCYRRKALEVCVRAHSFDWVKIWRAATVRKSKR